MNSRSLQRLGSTSCQWRILMSTLLSFTIWDSQLCSSLPSTFKNINWRTGSTLKFTRVISYGSLRRKHTVNPEEFWEVSSILGWKNSRVYFTRSLPVTEALCKLILILKDTTPHRRPPISSTLPKKPQILKQMTKTSWFLLEITSFSRTLTSATLKLDKL